MIGMDVGLLRRLSDAFGPPGHEEEPREILRAELEGFADEVRVDALGNIFFYHRGDEGTPLLMVAAHTDEVALLTTFIDDNGFIRFHTLGGIPAGVLPGQRFVFDGRKGRLRGIVGTKPPHLMTEEERKKVPTIQDLYVDVGAESRDAAVEKGCYIGMTGVFDVEFAELGDGYVRGKAFDDRAGCAVMAEAFKRLRGSGCTVVAVGTVQEEVGLRGARTAAWQEEPAFGLALEGTSAGDVPGSVPHAQSSNLRKGPVVTIADRSVITHPKVLNTLIEVAESNDIPYQFKKVPTGGTDAGAIHLTKAGIPSGTVATPCRYIHGPAAVTTVEDLENTVRLVDAFVRRISGK